jgi:REP element-mobilizing transposase RayT
MPRVPRIYLEGALYYVTSRGLQGQNIFSDKEDYLMYEELLSKYKSLHGFKLFAFILLPAHIHLLVETKPETTLSEIMHNITSAYIKYYNKKYSRQGHLFRGRFRAIPIEKETYLLKLTRYMHLNPGQLKLVDEAGQYPYSSCLSYMSPDESPAWKIDMRDEVKEALAYLEGRNYADYLREDTLKEGSVLHKDLHRKVFLGSEEFGSKIRESLKREPLRVSKEDAQESRRMKNVGGPFVSGIILAALTASALVYVQRIHRAPQKNVAPETKKVIPVAPLQRVDVKPGFEAMQGFEVTGLDNTTWQIKFVAGTPFQSMDILTFSAGKMNSQNMNLNGYASSNYSVTRDDDRLMWETMQASKAGLALWRGEVEGPQMKGVLSLRQKEAKPQDFSFVSLKTERP